VGKRSQTEGGESGAVTSTVSWQIGGEKIFPKPEKTNLNRKASVGKEWKTLVHLKI